MRTTYLLSVLLILMGCSGSNKHPKAEQIIVKWKLIENNFQSQTQLLSEFKFINTSKHELKSNWAFYFNTINGPINDSGAIVQFEHVNGDLYRMLPKENFILKPGDSAAFSTICKNWVTSYTDAPNGGFFVFNNKANEAEKSEIIIEPILETEKHTKRNDNDIMPVETPRLSYEKYIAYGLKPLAKDKLIPVIPSPKKYSLGNGEFKLDETQIIYYQEEFKNEANFLAEQLKSNIGISLKTEPIKPSIDKGITLVKEDLKNEEGYKLNITEKTITITANTKTGIFYGIQSLRNLLPSESYKSTLKNINLQAISIEDEPLFNYRGIFLDVARNFQSKESVLKLLDMMALYKINKFHFHFCDDEGWRIEIKTLPELNSVGSYRYFSDDPNVLLPSFGSGPHKEGHTGSGYYTREEFIEILKYATERHIEVIPELDMPGHSRAAIKSMNVRYQKYMQKGNIQEAEKYLLVELGDSSQYRSVQGWNDNVVNVCQPGLYNFIDEIVKELKGMFDEAGAKLTMIHTGGDEVPAGVWEKSKLCNKFLAENSEYKTIRQLQSHFVEEFKKILDKYQITTNGWEEIVLKQENGKWVKNDKMIGQTYIPYIWNSVWGGGMEDLSYHLANLGYKIVMCNVTNLYMDMAYVKNPSEPGYYWGAYTDTRKFFEFTPFDIRNCAYEDNMGHKLNAFELFKGKELLSEKGRKNVFGLEGLLWTENTKSPEMMEYMIFPKLLGLAERAWAQQPEWSKISNEKKRMQDLNEEWNLFANTLSQRELPKLDYINKGVNYRIPVPAGKISNDTLYILTEFPGYTVRYTTNGNEPQINSEIYTQPIKVTGTVIAKAFATNGKSSRKVVIK